MMWVPKGLGRGLTHEWRRRAHAWR